MKNLVFLSIALCLSITVPAQNITYGYKFNNSLKEQYPQGPELLSMCSGTYEWVNIPAGMGKNVYNFAKGCGLIFRDTGNKLAAGSYTIELYFKLDTINGYKKIIDYDSLSVDPGFYNQNGKLVMYNKFTSADSLVGEGVYQYVAVTRDGSSKKIYVYHNNKVVGSLNDTAGQYTTGTDNMLIFFRDDNGTGGEQSSGSVAMIQISNYVMDSTTIKGRFTNIKKILGVEESVLSDNGVKVFPNPAGDFVTVGIPVGATFKLIDQLGRVCRSGYLPAGNNQVSLTGLPRGIYLLSLADRQGVLLSTARLLRE